MNIAEFPTSSRPPDVYQQPVQLPIASSSEKNVSAAKIDHPTNSVKSAVEINYGTCMVHGELILAVPDFTESAYAKRMPWNDSFNSNWNCQPKPFGMFRCFFNKGLKGNYSNFYEMISPSKALPFYAKSTIPQYYSDEGNCDENTFCPEMQNRDFEEYKPFSIEGRGYSRSYFYGVGS